MKTTIIAELNLGILGVHAPVGFGSIPNSSLNYPSEIGGGHDAWA